MSSIAIDTETTGLNVRTTDHAFAIFTCTNDGDLRSWVFRVDPFTRQPIIDNYKKFRVEFLDYIFSFEQFIFHNIVFDIQALRSIGIEFPWRNRSHDTGVMSHVLHSRKTKQVNSKLKDLADIFLGIPTDDEKELKEATVAARRYGKKKGWNRHDSVEADYWMVRESELAQGKEESNLLSVYGERDVERTMSLFLYFEEGITQEDKWEQYELERQLYPVIDRMTSKGLPIRQEALEQGIKDRQFDIDVALNSMRDLIGDPEFNPASPIQLREVLFVDLGFVPTKMTKTGPSTDKYVLNDLNALPNLNTKQKLFLQSLETFRKKSTGLGYLKEYIHEAHEAVLYYSLKSNGTSTTRFSSSKPNAQNVGKGEDQVDEEGNAIVVDSLRSVFGPPEGYIWIAMDYSQLQLRIFAYESGERSLIEAFEQGWDAHDYMAHRIFSLGRKEKPTKNQRRIAKNVNFGFIFGASPKKIEQTAGMEGLWNTVTKMFPNAHAYMKEVMSSVYKNKYVETCNGYRLYLPYRDGKIAAHAGVNYIVQGDEGIIVKEALVSTDKYIRKMAKKYDARIVLQVHDELIFQFKRGKSLRRQLLNLRPHLVVIKCLMEAAAHKYDMIAPVDADLITTSWDQGKELDLND